MAFWNKGEDPWDVKPKPVSVPDPDRDGEPDTLLDSLKAWNEASSCTSMEVSLPSRYTCPRPGYGCGTSSCPMFWYHWMSFWSPLSL